MTLDSIAEKLAAGRSLSDEDGSALASTPDILAIGMLADDVRAHRHGQRTTFVRVADVTVAAALQGGSIAAASAGEIRLVGVPSSLEEAAAAVRAVRDLVGSAAVVTGFSLVDLLALAGNPGRASDALRRLKETGLDLVAEASVDHIDDLESAVRPTLDAGLPIARFVVEQTPGAERLSLLSRVGAVHRATGAVKAFAPLPRRTSGAPSTGYEDVKHVALARLILDEVPSIQVDWRLYGPKLAQVALTFGADDVDAVSAVDDMAEGRRRSPLEEILRNIRAAGFDPVPRNGRFEVIA
jgi:aminodeoxyfutalosine synthase